MKDYLIKTAAIRNGKVVPITYKAIAGAYLVEVPPEKSKLKPKVPQPIDTLVKYGHTMHIFGLGNGFYHNFTNGENGKVISYIYRDGKKYEMGMHPTTTFSPGGAEAYQKIYTEGFIHAEIREQTPELTAYSTKTGVAMMALAPTAYLLLKKDSSIVWFGKAMPGTEAYPQYYAQPTKSLEEFYKEVRKEYANN